MTVSFSLVGKRVWVAGHRGMAGSAIVRRLAAERCELVSAGRDQLDLRNQGAVEAWMQTVRPQVVFVAAATVGGIVANDSRPAEFIYDNLAIETNIVHGAWRTGVEKLLFLGSSCVYPKLAPQPLTEDALLTGALEPTNQWYAIAKIDFISAMPTNLYGPGDNYDLQQGHVVAALQVKIHRAKQNDAPAVEIWGSGTPRREFLYVDDLADALVFMVNHYSQESHLNVGTGTDVTIRELAEVIAKVAQYEGTFVYDRSKPDGTPRKVMDVGRLTALGWKAKTSLEQGLKDTYEAYANGLQSQQAA
jgi:GDP-L-fucose synthase